MLGFDVIGLLLDNRGLVLEYNELSTYGPDISRTNFTQISHYLFLSLHVCLQYNFPLIYIYLVGH